MSAMPNFSALLQGFFVDHLLRQRSASANTTAAYRDAFSLLLRFAAKRLRKEPSNLSLADLTASFIGEFLSHIEKQRHNSARTRNARLAAIHSFFRYVSFREPDHAEVCRQVLAIPSKRYERKPIEYLVQNEIDALLAAPGTQTWIGRRDRALLGVAIQTGLRVSELIGLQRKDVVLEVGAHVRCEGKGRKQRCTPLRREIIRVLKAWLKERPVASDTPMFPSSRGGPMSRDAVERLVARHLKTAQRQCPSLKRKRVTPHVLRHTAAMTLLQHGIDRSVIALWLGHEGIETTQMYLHADLRLKEKALARTRSTKVKPARYQPGDKLLAFLEGL